MFEGAYTAIVTPFNKDGSVDYDRFRALIDWQVAEGVDGIVPVGTTGESPTVDYKEHERIVEVAIEAARRRIKVIAGTGANSTAEALELTRHAKDAGADGTLQVTPYYNKPNSTGLIRHFSAVADLGLPTVLYNVPGRTSKEIPVEVVVELAKHPKIVSIKEAGGSVDRVSQIVSRCKIQVVSGDDSLTLPMMVVGAVGVISVASNVAPRAVADMVHHAQAGRWNEARALHLKYTGLFTDLFIDTNPIPVKTALAMMGKIEEVFRLPLCEISEPLRKKLSETLRSVKLDMSKIVIVGAGGRMGKTLVRCLESNAVTDLELVGAVDLWDCPDLGKEMGSTGIKITSDLGAVASQADVLIDFSSHHGTAGNAPRIAEWGKAWVIGTTGLGDDGRAAIEAASAKIPIVWAPNMSLGVNLLLSLLEEAGRALKNKGYDVEIIERHHRRKKDSPSGTALGMGQAVAEGMGLDLDEVSVHGRSGIASDERSTTEIGFHSIRAGDIVGDHTVLFATDGECIEFTHRATSRDTFAIGALRAAAWVAGRNPGLYSMRDVLAV